jgi:hypothetical protein
MSNQPMPVNRYQDGKIYKIVSGDFTYYGSTIQPLCKRYHTHKHAFKTHNGTNKVKYSSHALFDNAAPEIFLVESFPCNSVEELRARERYYIENFPCINKNRPGRTAKEWHIDNRDRRLKEMLDRYYRIKAEKQTPENIEQ